MNDFSQKEFDAIFSYLISGTDNVFWIRSADYKQQLYVTPSYENSWGYSAQELIENPGSFANIVQEQDLINPRLICSQKERRSLDTAENVSLFRVKQKEGDLLHIIDFSYVVHNNAGHAFVAGVGQRLTPSEWENASCKTIAELMQMPFQKYVRDILIALSKKLNLSPGKTENKKNNYHIITDEGKLKLSAREAQCFQMIAEGFSAKEIAQKLQISARTVEAYIENIKIKFNCRKTLALMKHVQNIDAVRHWVFETQQQKPEEDKSVKVKFFLGKNNYMFHVPR